jgi:putative ABC transport system substrate-binding protein
VRPGRRALLLALAAAAAGGARAAPQRIKVVGYLSGGNPPDELVARMAELGFVRDRDYRLEVRTPPNWDPPTLKAAAEELVAAKPDVLLAWQGNRIGALAAATKTIPIVCGAIPDPVGSGYAQSLRRPGGNVTGLSMGIPESAEITFGLVKKLRPALKRVGAVHPHGVPITQQAKAMVAAARAYGLEWLPLTLGTEDDIGKALAPLESQAFFMGGFRDQAMASRVMAAARDLRIAVLGYVGEGGLLSYGLDHENTMGRVAAILVKILRGANPAEIPFELPDRPLFKLNRTTARALGIAIPRDVELRVTEFVD